MKKAITTLIALDFVWGNAIKTSKSAMEDQFKLRACAEKIAADEFKDEQAP